ncbi:hypothetical protein LMG33818_000272 [Halomonadaceae bacterium LMG 33818]
MLRNAINVELIAILSALDIPHVMLTAGCLFQTIWNIQGGNSINWGIRDYDVFYYDDDTSWESEDHIIRQVDTACEHLGVHVEVRNQARVHLWYYEKFGTHCKPICSVTEGIDRFLMPICSVGIDVQSGELYSTHGLGDLESGILRMNPLINQPDLFLAKAVNYRARWPWLTIIPAIDE